jgi:hypothetical protein
MTELENIILNYGDNKEEWEKVMYPTLSQEACQKRIGKVHLARTPSLEEPLLAITIHLKINATYTHYNATNSLCL